MFNAPLILAIASQKIYINELAIKEVRVKSNSEKFSRDNKAKDEEQYQSI